jgi:hypothetical protein
MGEYEPNDSRNVTRTQNRAPGEPPRTGPQEDETRQQQQGGTELEQGELYQDGRGEQVEQTVAAEQQQQAGQREEAMERDADELDDPSRLDRND